MYTVYAITNEQGKIYIGHTENVEKRLAHHNGVLPSKKTSYTSKQKRGVWRLFYSELFETRSKAMKREKSLKSSRGRSFLRSELTKVE